MSRRLDRCRGINRCRFMLGKLLKDVRRTRYIYRIPDHLTGPELREYYFYMDEGELLGGHSQAFSFDDEGIPIIPTYVDVEARRMIYYPISIGQYGLAVFHTYLRTKSAEDRRRFLKLVDWFYDHRVSEDRLGDYWLTDVEKPEYRVTTPWKSGFAQSRAISMLLRGYQLTGEARYLQAATRALRPFALSVPEGGVTWFTPHGPFYEEYTAPFPTMVLDGMVFCLCGLYDYVRAGEDRGFAQELFEDGVRCLEGILPEYDLGFWIRFNKCEADFYPKVDPATIGYLRLVVTQLRMLYKLTGREFFQRHAEKWSRYDIPGNMLRMYIIKYKSLRELKRL